jgi:hypothetical protein
MADSAQIRSELNVFLQRKVASRVKNTLFNKMPTLDFLFSLNGSKKDADGLGRPTGDMLAIGRINGASRARRETVVAQREYLPVVQVSKPSKSDLKRMADYDTTPEVNNWDTTNAPAKRFKQPRFKFARGQMPFVIPHTDLRTVKRGAGDNGAAAASAVGSVYDIEVQSREAAHCELLNDDLFATAAVGIPTDEDVTQWDRFHSLHAAIHDSNVYAGIDRSLSANSWWKGNRHTSQFTGTFEAMLEFVNYDDGLIAKGLRIQLVLVGKDLMKKAKAEARSAGPTVQTGSMPDPAYGFATEAVQIGVGNRKVYVMYEPAIDALDTTLGTKSAICLDPSTFTVIFAPDGNFSINGPHDQTKIKGGAEIDHGTIQTEILLACEVPSGNAVFTDVSL